MDLIELSLILILAVALIGAAARRVPIPAPLFFILGGIALSFEPHLRAVKLDPQIFFLLFIPPLLFADGWLFPKREFVKYRHAILLLAFGLVTATVLVVGYTLHAVLPEIPLAAWFALGAVISPTDAVAVSAVTERLKLPLRMTTVLSGESLINDASGLVAFQFAVAAVVTGVFSLGHALVHLLLVAGGGVLIGVAVSWTIGKAREQLTRGGMEAPEIQTCMSLLTPFVAYVAAESATVSGILAVVAAGVHSGLHDLRSMTTETRMLAWDVWRLLLFILNGLVFLLLGLQLPQVWHAIRGYSWQQLLGYALLVSAIVIITRVAWVFPGSRLALLLARRHDPGLKPARWRDVFIAGWAGLRGAVTLAAALSLPLAAGGAPFPGRDLLIFLASSVIVITLVFNGLTLPLLIRWFGVKGDHAAEQEERAARIAAAQAAIRKLRKLMDHQEERTEREFTMQLIGDYERRIEEVKEEYGAEGLDASPRLAAERTIRLAAVEAQRAELQSLLKKGRINEQVLFVIQRELDHLEAVLLPRAEGA
jgi:CPA1 family monovalent cation:H+ antiporter